MDKIDERVIGEAYLAGYRGTMYVWLIQRYGHIKEQIRTAVRMGWADRKGDAE